MNTFLPLLLCVFAVIGTKGADSPSAPAPWITTSARGGFLFKMVPEKWRKEGEKIVMDREAFGVAYALNEDGEFKEIWRTQGWYAFDSHLSEDGRYLARMGAWATDQENHTDLAVAFYDRGRLLKQYQVKELIKRPGLIENSASHYMWRAQTQTEPNGFKGGAFHLVMIDKTIHRFDVHTGRLMSSEIDKGARGAWEVREQERQPAKMRGSALYESSSFRADYEKDFLPENMETGGGKTLGVWFESLALRADLRPKKKYAHPCKVEAGFPVYDDDSVPVSITPEEIDAALLTALAHPFVAQLFSKGGATGIRLRITGDRLHWRTMELRESLTRVKKQDAIMGKLRHWAELIIDVPTKESTAIFLNTQTQDVIYEDHSRWPREPELWEAGDPSS